MPGAQIPWHLSMSPAGLVERCPSAARERGQRGGHDIWPQGIALSQQECVHHTAMGMIDDRAAPAGCAFSSWRLPLPPPDDLLPRRMSCTPQERWNVGPREALADDLLPRAFLTLLPQCNALAGRGTQVPHLRSLSSDESRRPHSASCRMTGRLARSCYDPSSAGARGHRVARQKPTGDREGAPIVRWKVHKRRQLTHVSSAVRTRVRAGAP